MALPRGAREANKINGRTNRLGKNGFIVLQGFQERRPNGNKRASLTRAGGTNALSQPIHRKHRFCTVVSLARSVKIS
jgi:hypothetical protein